MTFSRQWRSLVQLAAFTVLLLTPGLAIHFGLMPFAYRTYALVAVSGLCIALCVLSGLSLADLGLGRPSFREHWLGCVVLTLGLAAIMVLQTRLFSFDAEPPVWLSFAPFYVLVSSPCQEVICRSIPKLMTDRLQARGWVYVLYSSAVFSLIHIAYGDTALMLNTFAVGIVWGIAYLRMLNIWPMILSHAAIGTLAFSLGLA
ncbi:MAG: CPBP family intramembrane metalloprotease [Tardiphaga sp.]|nr:CPBP family intramembrane metalloprotease [Tardiphaga sp.]